MITMELARAHLREVEELAARRGVQHALAAGRRRPGLLRRLRRR